MFLLDVNALLAFGVAQHQFHARVASWIESISGPTILTCSITQLAFVRILSVPSPYGFSVSQATDLLLGVLSSEQVTHRFIADGNDIVQLPPWVASSRQTTDGHLLQLAHTHKAIFATLDERIPGGYVIPHLPI